MIVFFTLCFVFVPAVCFAHSGTVLTAVSNYWSFLLPFISGLIILFRNFFARHLGFFKNKKSDDVK